MKLNDILSVTTFSPSIGYSVTVWEPDHKKARDVFHVDHASAQDYDGPFYSKSHREEYRKNKKLLKQYGDYEVDKILIFGSSIDFYMTAK